MKRLLKKILTDPLVHFLLLGTLIFIFYSRVNPDARMPNEKIVISSGNIQQLVNGFTRTWQRPPTPQELQGLIHGLIREELSYRKAKNMGLDIDDTIVRRRMQQKLEFLAEDITSPSSTPSDNELFDYFKKHRSHYKKQAKIDFEQLFFKEGVSPHSGKFSALAALNQLRANPDNPDHINSDPSLLPIRLSQTPIYKVRDLFGDSFANNLAQSKPRDWIGPIRSNYGYHLVCIHSIDPGYVPEFNAIREIVMRDFLAARQKASIDKMYSELSQHYTIEIQASSTTE